VREYANSFEPIDARECICRGWGRFTDFYARADPAITDFPDVGCVACIGGEAMIQFETTSSATFSNMKFTHGVAERQGSAINFGTTELAEVKGWKGR
jgi:hypothetical protein